MTDDHQDFGIGDHVARVGDADLRFGLIVLRHQHEIVAQRFECLDRLLDGELRAELDMFAERGLLARERRLHGDFDFTFLRPRGRRQRGKQRQHVQLRTIVLARQIVSFRLEWADDSRLPPRSL